MQDGLDAAAGFTRAVIVHTKGDTDAIAAILRAHHALTLALAAAVRRDTLAEVRKMVEGAKVYHRDGCEQCRGANWNDCINESRAVFGNAALDAALTTMGDTQ